jgi:hypothetical protein
VKNLIAPLYGVLDVVLPLIGIDLNKYLKLEEFLDSLSFGIELGAFGKFDLNVPRLNFHELASQGASKIVEVSTARSTPDKTANTPWANSFNEKMTADQYAAYVSDKDLTNASLFKNTQTTVVADTGDTLVYILTWALNMFAAEENQQSIINWICDFFELKSGARTTVEWAVKELFIKAKLFNSTDIIVSALLYALGMGVVLNDSIMGNVAVIQQIFKQLFEVIGKNSTVSYGEIARVMEELTHVWEETIGPEEDYEDAKGEAEETLNWFQKLIKKIKEFFQRLFSIFK